MDYILDEAQIKSLDGSEVSIFAYNILPTIGRV